MPIISKQKQKKSEKSLYLNFVYNVYNVSDVNEKVKTLYRSSFGCTAIPVSPIIVSIRVVATVKVSSEILNQI